MSKTIAVAAATPTSVPPAVVEALRKKALEKALGKSSEEVVMEAEPEPATPLEWPNAMTHSMATVQFSKLFPREWKECKKQGQPDFAVPDYRKHPFPAHLTPYIPTESDYRAEPQLVYDAVLAFAAGSVTHLVGWPGTGKSNGLPVLVASRLGLPLLRLGLNKKGMMFDDLIGREAIKQTTAGTITGHRDGVLLAWITHPCIILADEFARANAEITNGLMSMMERGGALIVENREAGTVIKRHEHCWILASDNVKGLGDGAGKFVGTDMVDNAVLDRFEVTLEVDYLSEEDQLFLINQWYPGFPETEAKKLVKFGKMIQDGYKKDTLPISFSPRALKECARYACLHQNMANAIKKVVVAKYAEEADVNCIREFYRTAFGKTLA